MVENLLENGLDDSDSWVDASSRDSGRDQNSSVKSHSDGKSINWHVLRSVVFGNLKNKSNKESSHEGLNKQSFEHHNTTIIAAKSWAELGDIVRSWSWKGLSILWCIDHSSGTSSTSNECSKALEDNHGSSEYDAETKTVMSMLNHHSQCNSWIKMRTTN